MGALCTANHIFTAYQPGQLSIKEGEELEISSASEEAGWYKVANREGEIGLVPVSSVKIHPWFHANITRAEAELTLSSEINGSFLVRKSKSRAGEYALSLRHDGSTNHFIIDKDPFTSQYHSNSETFSNLSKLTAYCSKFADGLPTALRYPTINPHKTSIPREVDEWEVDRLDIATGQRTWENEHSEIYKAVIKKRGLSVAIKTFKVRYTKDFILAVHYCIV